MDLVRKNAWDYRVQSREWTLFWQTRAPTQTPVSKDVTERAPHSGPRTLRPPQSSTHLSGGGTRSARSWCWSTWEHQFLSSSHQHHRDPRKVNTTIPRARSLKTHHAEKKKNNNQIYAFKMPNEKGGWHCRCRKNVLFSWSMSKSSSRAVFPRHRHAVWD